MMSDERGIMVKISEAAEKLICGIKNSVKQNYSVFIGTFITSIIFYFYYLKEEPFISDCYNEGILKFRGALGLMGNGRWAVKYLYMSSANIVHPLLFFIAYTLCISVVALILTEIWEIKKGRYLIGALLIVAPACADQISFIQVFNTFGAAVLCSALALLMVFKYRSILTLVLAVFFVTVMLGLYQAYLGTMLFAMVLTLIIVILKEETTSAAFFNTVFRCFISTAAGCIAYWVLMKLHLSFFDVGITTYGGADKVGLLASVKNIPSSMMSTYKIFIDYYNEHKLYIRFFWMILFAAGMIVLFREIYDVAKKKEYWRVVIIILLMAAAPPCANIIRFITPDYSVSLRTSFQMQITAPFLLAVVGGWNLKKPDMKGVLQVCSVLCAIGLLWGYNFRAFSTYRTMAIGDRCIKHVVNDALINAQSDEEYEPDMPIVFLGFVDEEKTQAMNPLREYSYYDSSYSFWKLKYEMYYVWRQYCWYNFGVDIGELESEEYDAILASDEFASMTEYPSDGAYKVINGRMCVLLDKDSVAYEE